MLGKADKSVQECQEICNTTCNKEMFEAFSVAVNKKWAFIY